MLEAPSKRILEGQVAVVAGAGQGICKAIALRFVREGAGIGILEINNETGNKTAQRSPVHMP